MTHVYDPMNLAILRNPAPDAADWAAAYTADDERLIVWDTRKGTPQETWTLRGLDGRVLREYFYGSDITGELIFSDGFENNDNGDHLCAWTRQDGTTPTCQGSLPGEPTWSIRHSYVYRGDALLADSSQGIAQQFHLDHLGSVRQVSSDGAVVARCHDYLPYGAEVPGSSGSGLRFTGHERDEHGVGGGDDLDYMHAQYCSPRLGRFLSVDPIRSATLEAPQSWNRYGYSRGNPLRYTDPDGRQEEAQTASLVENITRLLKRVRGSSYSGLPSDLMFVDGEFKRAGLSDDKMMGLLAGAVVVSTFADLFDQAEPEDPKKSHVRTLENADEADAQEAFDAITEPGSRDTLDTGEQIGVDKKTGRTIVLRGSSDGRTTLDEQRITEHGKKRSNELRFGKKEDPEKE